jgi:hypothetical protein
VEDELDAPQLGDPAGGCVTGAGQGSTCRAAADGTQQETVTAAPE